MKTETTKNNSICESCGEDFFCGANAEKCWCFAIDLSSETLAELRENFKICLCENCLNSQKSLKATLMS